MGGGLPRAGESGRLAWLAESSPMRTMGYAAMAVAGSLAACAPPAAPKAGPDKEYLVFYADGRAGAALSAVERAGGHLVSTDAKLGYVVAKGGGDAFVEALGADQAVVGVTPDREIGFAAGLTPPQSTTAPLEPRAVPAPAAPPPQAGGPP